MIKQRTRAFNPPSRNSSLVRVRMDSEGNSASEDFRRSERTYSTGVSPWSFKKKGVPLIWVALFIAFVVFFCEEVTAQDEAVVREAEQAVSWEEQVKDEPVIFIVENETLTLNDDWSYTTTEHRKFKINKEEAKTLGELKFYYNKSREKIKGIKAYTITPDGKKHQYTKIQDLSVYEFEPMYSDIRMKIISLPKVSVGSIIEYEITTIAKQGPIRYEFLLETHFDIKTPSKEMNIVYDFPKHFAIQYKEFNLKYKPTITHSDKRITYAWHLGNLYEKRPAVPEEYVPAPTSESIENAIQFSSIKNWSSVARWYLSLINKNFELGSAIEKTAEELTQDYTSARDKARAIKEYIDKNFRYVSMLFGENTYEPHPTTEVFKNRYGDCKDLSLLCMAMLEAAGAHSHMALFNDEFSISDPQYDLPMPFVFNHALLIVEDEQGGDFYFDPLLHGYDIGEYPPSYQAAYTFIITEDGGRFGRFAVFDEKRTYTKTELAYVIKGDGSAEITLDAVSDLDSSIGVRSNFKAMTPDEKKEVLENMDALYASGGEVLERRIDNLDAEYGTVTTHMKMHRPDVFPVIDNMMIIDLEVYDRGGSFVAKERKKPIFYSINALDEKMTTYKIPEGFSVSYAAEGFDLDIEFFNAQRKITHEGDIITVNDTSRYRRTQLPKEAYAKIKDFFDKLSSKTKQRIVLKKRK